MDTDWDEQQLQHFQRIRSGLLKTGFSKDVAESQAARAVRQKAARPARQRRSDEATKDELYLAAKRYDIAGRSQMDKRELEQAVRAYREAHPKE